MSSLGTASVMYMKMTKNTFEIIPYEDRYKPELLAISLPWLEENDILEPADLERILVVTGNIPILCNGGTSYKLFAKHQEKRLGIQAQQMPSTSPANAAWKLDKLVETWGEALLPILYKEGETK